MLLTALPKGAVPLSPTPGHNSRWSPRCLLASPSERAQSQAPSAAPHHRLQRGSHSPPGKEGSGELLPASAVSPVLGRRLGRLGVWAPRPRDGNHGDCKDLLRGGRGMLGGGRCFFPLFRHLDSRGGAVSGGAMAEAREASPRSEESPQRTPRGASPGRRRLLPRAQAVARPPHCPRWFRWARRRNRRDRLERRGGPLDLSLLLLSLLLLLGGQLGAPEQEKTH